MTHAVTKPNAPIPLRNGDLVVHQVPAWQDNLIWLISSKTTGEAAAVDGPEAGPVLAACRERGLNWTTILNTHTHHDHIGINQDLGEQLKAMRVIGPAKRADDVPGLTEPVSQGSSFELFGHPVKVLLTEGHIDGHISFVFEGAVFCGDTLFAGGCGYLFDGPPAKMHESLSKLSSLPDDTLVFCAHEYTQDNLRFAWSIEPDNSDLASRIRDTWTLRAEGASTVPSTVGLEKKTNPFLRTESATIRKHLSRIFPTRRLEKPEDIFAATRELKDQKTYRTRSDNELPLATRP